jgi:hypothetical protein
MTISPLSVSMLETASGGAPPFIRFNLLDLGKRGQQRVLHWEPPLLPAAMEHLNVPVEHWNMLWEKIDPIIRTLKRREMVMMGLSLVMSVAYLGALIHFIGSFIWMFGAYLVFLVLRIWVAEFGQDYWREKYMEKIRSICREEEQQVFRSQYGVALECDYEKFNVGRADGIYLYFIPLLNSNTRADETDFGFPNGHLSVGVLEQLRLPAWCGWNSMSPSLPSSDNSEYLPSGMESISLDDWAAFWSKLGTLSHLYISYARNVTVTISCFPLYMLVDSVWVGSHPVIDIIFLVACLVAWYSLGQLDSIVVERTLLVKEYSDKFAEQGVYMEYRIQINRPARPCHHVYLFPTSGGHTA